MAVKRILLLEDNSDDEAPMLHALRGAQVTDDIVVVRDAAEAMDYLAGRIAGDLPTLILVDMTLPSAGGLELLRSVRAAERTKLLPVVVLTPAYEEEDVRLTYQLGANSCIRKPLDVTELAEVVREIGRYWLLLNEPLPAR
jgi:two-component system response regulator